MIYDIEEYLKTKPICILHKIIGYDGWGSYDSKIIKVADNYDELKKYCDSEELEYTGSYPSYIITKPTDKENMRG